MVFEWICFYLSLPQLHVMQGDAHMSHEPVDQRTRSHLHYYFFPLMIHQAFLVIVDYC